MVQDSGAPKSHPGGLSFTQYESGAAVVLAVHGEIDMLTAPHVTDAVLGAARDRPAVIIVDLTDVEFFGSAGATALLNSKRAVAATTRQVVVADGPATGRSLKVMGLDAELELYPRLADAIAAIEPST